MSHCQLTRSSIKLLLRPVIQSNQIKRSLRFRSFAHCRDQSATWRLGGLPRYLAADHVDACNARFYSLIAFETSVRLRPA